MNSCGDLLFRVILSCFLITGLALDMAVIRAKQVEDNGIIQSASNNEEVQVNSSKVALVQFKAVENVSHPVYHEIMDTYCTPRCDPIFQRCIGYNQCVDRHRCGVNFDCPEGQMCTDSLRCVICIESDDCPGDKVCIRGVCTTCYSDSHCSPGLVCHNGECMNCWHDHHCYGKEICYGGRCTTCQNHMHCPGDTVCVNGECKVCVIQSDCGGYGRCINGQCRICTQDEQCRNGYMCSLGLCKARLLENLA